MTGEERRAAILEAAMRLFSERGFRGTTTRALAKAVGVTEPVLYGHFKSKRELYAAIIEAKSREGLARGVILLEPYALARDDRALFIGVGEFVLQSHSKDQGYSRLLLSVSLEDPDLGRVFYERQRPGFNMLAAYIALRIAEGAFRLVDPKLAARAFLGMLEYHGMLGMLYRDDFVSGTAREIAEGMVDIFLQGILKERGAK
jgi:AcrR family transcriptional regulator